MGKSVPDEVMSWYQPKRGQACDSAIRRKKGSKGLGLRFCDSPRVQALSHPSPSCRCKARRDKDTADLIEKIEKRYQRIAKSQA